MILSATMMLRIALKEEKAAEILETAIDKVFSKGFRTPDLANETSIKIGCKGIGDEILEVIKNP